MTAAERKRLEKAMPWLFAAGILLVWQGVCSLFNVSDFIFPSPINIVKALVEYAKPIGQHAWQTFWTTMAGFAIGVVVGLSLGIAVGTSRLVYRGLYPLLIAFNSIPKAAFVPILVVWFGIGSLPAILTAFLISFFPIVVNVATGLATLEPELEDVLRSLGARPIDILLKVGLPRSLPYFFAALKVSITLAFVGTVVSETVASNEGIGYLMMSAGSSMKMPLVFAGLFVIGVMAMVMYELFAVIERRLTGWAHRGAEHR
jgi:NitT/TauT family transport system permease protein